MKLEDFYQEEKDILGEPQLIDGFPFYPIKLFDTDQANTMRFLLARDKMEFVKKREMPFDGVKEIYKTSSYLRAMLYGYSFNNINMYYYILNRIQDFLCYICQIDNDKEDNGIAIITRLDIVNPLDIFTTPLYIILQKEDRKMKIDDEMFDIIRKCILKQSGISLKSLEGYNEEMEKLKIDKYKSEVSMSFSDEIFSFIAMSGMDIYNESFRRYTLYQFKYHFSYLQQYIDYKSLYPLQASGQVKFGSPIKYYLEPLNFDKGRYDDLLIKADDFAQSGIAKSVDSFNIPDNKINKTGGR